MFARLPPQASAARNPPQSPSSYTSERPLILFVIGGHVCVSPLQVIQFQDHRLLHQSKAS